MNNVSNILDTITNLIPSNPFASFVNGDMLSILVFAVIIGFAILALQEKAQPLMDLITSVNEVSMKILFEVMKFTPLGVLCTIMPVLATTGADTVDFNRNGTSYDICDNNNIRRGGLWHHSGSYSKNAFKDI